MRVKDHRQLLQLRARRDSFILAIEALGNGISMGHTSRQNHRSEVTLRDDALNVTLTVDHRELVKAFQLNLSDRRSDGSRWSNRNGGRELKVATV